MKSWRGFIGTRPVPEPGALSVKVQINDHPLVAPRGQDFQPPRDKAGAARLNKSSRRRAHGHDAGGSLNRRSDDDATTIKERDLQRSASVVTQVSVPENRTSRNTVKLGPGGTRAWIPRTRRS